MIFKKKVFLIFDEISNIITVSYQFCRMCYFKALWLGLGGIALKTMKIPEATIIRLSVYSRFLSLADHRGIVTISSNEIAEGVGVSSAQVRKDLAYFGEFGTRGVGYNVKDLHWHIMKILGLNTIWPVVIVGAGNLGTALSMYGDFGGLSCSGFSIGSQENRVQAQWSRSLSSS